VVKSDIRNIHQLCYVVSRSVIVVIYKQMGCKRTILTLCYSVHYSSED